MTDKELFLKFEEIRKSGKYNMFTDGFKVMSELKMNPRHKSDCSRYLKMLQDYSVLAAKWL